MTRTPSTQVPVLVLVLVAVLVAVLVPVPAAATASPPEPSGAIESVVVFPDRARVTRARAVACENGIARAVFERLPVGLDTRTLRGEVREAAEVIGLVGEQVNETVAADPRARALGAERERIDAEIKASETRKEAIASEVVDVGEYAGLFSEALAEEMRNPKPDTRGWALTLEGLRARRAALAEERRKLDVALRGLKAEAEKVGREIAQVGGPGQRAYRTATLTIGCRSLARVTAAVSYVVEGAGWQPEYDVDVTPAGRAKTGSAAARITVGAVVRQTTGEDWTDVRMMLSTARPRLDAQAPVPAPLVLYAHEEERGKKMISAHDRREQLQSGASATPKPQPPPPVAVDDKGNAFVLTLPRAVSVVADGRPVWAPVDVVETQATVKLVATPKLDEHVYQIAVLKNPAAYPLLEGRVRSYRGGSYVGNARLAHQGVGAPFEISLGIDEELKAERNTLDDKDVEAGFLSSTKHIVRAFRTKLTNQAAGAETIELREQIPVSKIADIRVDLLGKPTTAGYQLDGARGFVTWSVTLVRGEWRTVDLGYAIHLPDSWEVAGR